MDLRYKRSAIRQMRSLPPKTARRIKEKMKKVAEDPYRADTQIKPLSGVKNGYRRRFGDYRVLYTVDGELEVLEVFKVGHRGSVYR